MSGYRQASLVMTGDCLAGDCAVHLEVVMGFTAQTSVTTVTAAHARTRAISPFSSSQPAALPSLSKSSQPAQAQIKLPDQR